MPTVFITVSLPARALSPDLAPQPKRRALPKSHSLRRPSAPSSRLSGLMSPCATPEPCRYARPCASAPHKAPILKRLAEHTLSSCAVKTWIGARQVVQEGHWSLQYPGW